MYTELLCKNLIFWWYPYSCLRMSTHVVLHVKRMKEIFGSVSIFAKNVALNRSVHSKGFGTFNPPFMSRVIDPTITNISLCLAAYMWKANTKMKMWEDGHSYVWGFAFKNSILICLLWRWSKFIDQMINITHIELDAIFEACFTWVDAQITKEGWYLQRTCNKARLLA